MDFAVDTTGYIDIILSFASTRNNQGFDVNTILYSTDGVNWDRPDLNVYDLSAKRERLMGGPNNAVADGAYTFGLLREPDPASRHVD